MAALFISGFAAAQKKIQTDTLIVNGVCGMCKDRIESAAYGKGVVYASWNQATDELSVVFKSNKTSLEEIEQRVVAAGHSTQSQEAARNDYDRLPQCCRYEELHKH